MKDMVDPFLAGQRGHRNLQRSRYIWRKPIDDRLDIDFALSWRQAFDPTGEEQLFRRVVLYHVGPIGIAPFRLLKPRSSAFFPSDRLFIWTIRTASASNSSPC